MESRKKKLLIIDDNEIVRLMFSNIFWLHGLDENYDLVTIGHLDESETLLTNPALRPDIIFMGLVMPFTKNGKVETSAEAGFSMLKRIKDDPATSSIRVIIFSSYDEDGYRKRALESGAEMYLKKDENMPQDIIRIIRSFDDTPK
ncbi:MAG: response regulator transcription factor [Candidatus Yonathbacteria bacterium]|nr:response regulator transcription factor [Candidatus Yonathbacteria bacterium]